MNGGAIENNAATAFGGGVCFDASDWGGTVPKIELNAGTIKNNLRQVIVGDEYQITGGISNDLAVTGKDYGKCDRYLYISREAAVGDQAVYFQTGSKTPHRTTVNWSYKGLKPLREIKPVNTIP